MLLVSLPHFLELEEKEEGGVDSLKGPARSCEGRLNSDRPLTFVYAQPSRLACLFFFTLGKYISTGSR